MTDKEKFIEALKEEGYKLNTLGYWEQPGNNTLIFVKNKNFNRIHRFESGMLGIIEVLPFSKTHVLKWYS